jgi:hypothetical protein
MIVKPQAEGPTLFSGVLPLRVQQDQDVTIRNVKLLPGVKVLGVLSDVVPRPIRNGYVIVNSVPKPAENSFADKNPSLTWDDWTEIKDDGTFELASIPRGGELQIIGICDGWVSSTNIPEANGHYTMGQQFQLDKDKPQIKLTLEMEHTGSLELTVLQPDGSPLNQGIVASTPNQHFLKGGSTFLGERYRTQEIVELQLLPIEKQSRPRFAGQQLFPFQRDVVDGKVTLTGLPIGQSQYLVLVHPQLVLKSDEKRQRVLFKLDSAEPKLMTLYTTLPKTAPTENETDK